MFCNKENRKHDKNKCKNEIKKKFFRQGQEINGIKSSMVMYIYNGIVSVI